MAKAVAQQTGSGVTAAPSKTLRIAIFATYRQFMEDIVLALDKDHDVLCFKGGSSTEMLALLNWCDVAWVDWCDQLLIAITQLPTTKPIIARLHSFEIFTDMPKQVNWSKVDHLVFVNDIVQERFKQLVKDCPPPQSIIYTGVNLDKFQIPVDKEYGKKVAYVGEINYKKNPILALQCFREIRQHDMGYSFHVAGVFEDPRIKMYWDYFIERHGLPVVEDGYVEDMPAWYADKDYILSSSIFESFQYAIAEGIACGLMPLIHQWPGAEKIYWPAVTFSSPDECLGLCKTYEVENKIQTARKFRGEIEKRYGLQDQLAEIEQLLQGVAE